MMSRIVKYKVFSSSKEFEDWQISNLFPDIIQVSPFFVGADENRGNINFNTAAFVTYLEDHPTKE